MTNKQDLYDHYGTLITVFSLVMIVVYSSDRYDIWDAILGIIAFVYGLSYLWRQVTRSLVTHLLVSAITSTSLVLMIGFYRELRNLPQFSCLIPSQLPDTESHCLIGTEFVYALGLLVFVFILSSFFHRSR